MITVILLGDRAVIARLAAMGAQLRRGPARASVLPRKGAQRFRPAGIPLPARAFLRSALREMTPRIEQGLKEAVGEALRR